MTLVILDRDGVINFDSRFHIKSPNEWEAIPGSLEAIARLSRAEFRVVVATNQSGIARGLFDINTLNRIHQKMVAQAQEKGGKIDAIFFCPHAPEALCNCRKPNPGLLLEASLRLGEPLSNIPFVGDSISDILAAQAAGAQPVLVKTGNGLASHTELMTNNKYDISNVTVCSNLSTFVDSLVNVQQAG